MASQFIREIIFQLSVIDSRRFQILSHVQNFGQTYILPRHPFITVATYLVTNQDLFQIL